MFRETFITRFIVRGRGNESKSRRKRRTEESEILLEKREKESFGKNHIALSSDPGSSAEALAADSSQSPEGFTDENEHGQPPLYPSSSTSFRGSFDFFSSRKIPSTGWPVITWP